MGILTFKFREQFDVYTIYILNSCDTYFSWLSSGSSIWDEQEMDLDLIFSPGSPELLSVPPPLFSPSSLLFSLPPLSSSSGQPGQVSSSLSENLIGYTPRIERGIFEHAKCSLLFLSFQKIDFICFLSERLFSKIVWIQ